MSGATPAHVAKLNSTAGLVYRIGLTMFAVLAATAAAKGATPNQVTQSVKLPCVFDEPQLVKKGQTYAIAVKDCDKWRRVGEPVLPYRTIRVLIPAGLSIDKIGTVPETPPGTIAINAEVEFGRAPVARPNANQPRLLAAPVGERDAEIYDSPNPFPAANVQLASVQRMNGYDIAFVRVFPIRYTPVGGRLEFSPRLSVNITFGKPASKSSAGAVGIRSEKADEEIGRLVANPEAIQSYQLDRGGNNGIDAAVDYLLITSASLTNAFQPLVDQKVADGLSVKIETVGNIVANYTGRDVPEKIRNYVKYAYTNWGIRFVLLGGDVATVPCRYAYAYMGALTSDYFVPCDLYYACLDGSWDHNNNNAFGEPDDGENGQEVDLLGEVYVGRAPVDTVGEVNIFVQKTLQYETQAHPNRDDILIMAEYLGTQGGVVTQGWDMFVPLTNSFSSFQITRLDDAPMTTPQWTYVDAIDALNQTPHLMLFNGHGDPDSMMRMFTEDLDFLTNPFPFLAYSVGCDAGAFDNDQFGTDSIGEELVKRNSAGAFAAILNSRLGWYDPQEAWKWSGEFQIKFFDHLLNQGQTRLGVANQLGKLDMVGQIETSGLMTYRYCYFEITLFGDPHVAWQALSTKVKLATTSAHGGSEPQVGQVEYNMGELVTSSVTNSPLAGGAGTQFVCTGWSGSGSVPSSGSGTQVSFNLTEDSQISWLWKTQFWFAANSSQGGSVSATSGWSDDGSAVALQATPAPYYHFESWSGDFPAGQQKNLSINVAMTQPRAITAVFAENRTTHGTPEWWLASFGVTNDFEAASSADDDHDGMPAWEEYIAGTNPADGSSALRLSLRIDSDLSNNRVVEWQNVSGHLYTVYRSRNATGPYAIVSAALQGTTPTIVFSDSENDPGPFFYQVVVERSP